MLTAAGVDTSGCSCHGVAGWANGDLDVFAKTAEGVVVAGRRSVDPGASTNMIAAMSVSHRDESRGSGTSADRGALTLSGALLLVGFVVNATQRMIWHPTGEEDDHEAIFTEYTASDA